MEDMKEKLLCILKNKIIESKLYPWDELWLPIKKFPSIYLYKNQKWVEEVKTVFLIFTTRKRIKDGFEYLLTYDSNKYLIAEDEYNDIINLREEKIKERQMEELTKLCNNE